MNIIILGNILSLCGSVCDAISGTCKKPKTILAVQTISPIFYSISSIVLKGYSAVVQNIVGMLRNILVLSGKKWKWAQWLLTIAGVAFGFYFNNRGVLGWLPVLANLEYTLCVFKFGDNQHYLKIALIIVAILFLIFNIVILNFVGAAANLLTAITTGISLWKEWKKEGTA